MNYEVQMCIRCLRKKRVSKFPQKSGSVTCCKCLGKERRVLRKMRVGQEKTKPQKQVWADQMREHMTPAEKHLWKILQKMSPLFLPQQVIGGYIADFYCPRFRVLVEVDGSSHIGREEYDAQRDKHIGQHNHRTMRFTNEQVMSNRAEVVAKILEAL